MSSFGASVSADDDEDQVKVKSPEEQYMEISADMNSRIPAAFDAGAVLRAYPVRYDECLNTVLHMELGKFNRLVVKIKDTCLNLGKAVKGLVVFSPELEAVANGSASPSPPPSVSPSPPSPPSEPPEVIIIWNDPHIKFAHGGSADFRGKHNTLFNLLSHTNLTVNVRFSDAKYTDGKRVVTGSYMTEAFVHVATKSGPQLRISLKAGAIKPEHADVEWHQPAAKGPSAATKQLALTPSAANEVSESSTISEGDVAVSVQQGVGSGEALAMTITQKGRWSVGVTTHVYMDESSGKPVEMYRVDVELQPLSKDIEKEAVAPHGLIGQSFDGDEIGVTGKQDDYTKDEVVTTAQAEGAIEGTWTDYIMAEPFANDFKFSRFAGQAAKPRALDKLKGVKTMRKVSNNPSKIWA